MPHSVTRQSTGVVPEVNWALAVTVVEKPPAVGTARCGPVKRLVWVNHEGVEWSPAGPRATYTLASKSEPTTVMAAPVTGSSTFGVTVTDGSPGAAPARPATVTRLRRSSTAAPIATSTRNGGTEWVNRLIA